MASGLRCTLKELERVDFVAFDFPPKAIVFDLQLVISEVGIGGGERLIVLDPALELDGVRLGGTAVQLLGDKEELGDVGDDGPKDRGMGGKGEVDLTRLAAIE